MKTKHKRFFVVLILALTLVACGSNITPAEDQWEYIVEKSKEVPGSFTFDDDNKFARPTYTESCDATIPYLAEHGINKQYSGYIFRSTQTSSETSIQIIDDTEISVAKAEFLVTLSKINIENHVVNLEDQTVYFEGSDNGQVLDPSVWLQRAIEISETVPVTKITVSYVRNHMFNPNFEKADWHERIYWLETLVNCQTANQ